MALREAGSSITIRLPHAQVWDKLRDLTQAHNYVPTVKETRMDTEQREGIGTSRTVFLKDGSEMQETVEKWTEACEILLRLHKGDKPAAPIFKRFYFRYAIEDAGPDTQLSTALIYETKFGPLGWLLGKLAHGKMQGSAHDVGIAMKEYYETGEPVTSARFRELKAAES